MKDEIYIILYHRNIRIKAIEKLSDGRYRLIDGDVVGPKEIKEIQIQKKK